MSVNLSLFAGVGAQFFDDSGNPLVGGKLYSYLAGSNTPQATYTDSSGITPHANPIILDSAGRVPGNEIWVTEGISMKFVLKNSSDATIYTVDNINTSYIAADLASTADNAKGDALVGFKQALLSGFATGSIGRDLSNKMQEVVSVMDFIPQSEQANIQAGTSTYDCLAAFQNAIKCAPTGLDTTFYQQGVTVNVPPGKYYLSDTLKIDRNIVLRGAGAPYANCNGISQLVFADNKDGILCVDYRDSPSNKQGTGLVIENLHLSPKNIGGTVGSGISLKTTARIFNVTCVFFGEHGIKIDASTSYSPASNANLWEIHSCTLDSNGQHGLYVKGADANAGAGYNINAVNNGGWGIYDSSFLGNTYVGCHTANNTSGSYKSDNANARNIFVGCYSEADQPTASVVQPSMIVGGLHAAGYGANDPVLDSGGSTYGGLLSNANFSTGLMNLGVGQPNTSGTGLKHLDTSGSYSWTFSKATGRWGYQWASLGSPAFFMFYDRLATPANGYARDLSAENGGIGIAEHYFGSPTSMKYRGLGSSAPGSGTYLQGDIIWNSAPTSGGYIGWVCTAGGTPGTWKTFGLIS